MILYLFEQRERKGMNEDTSPVLDGGINPESRKDDDVSYTSKASPSDSHHSSSSSSPQYHEEKCVTDVCRQKSDVQSKYRIYLFSKIKYKRIYSSQRVCIKGLDTHGGLHQSVTLETGSINSLFFIYKYIVVYTRGTTLH